MADPYSTLGIARGASEADIKKAYRKLAKELHPDKHPDNPKATERFSNVTAAYDLLSDADKRARFDRGEIDGDGNPASPFGAGARGSAGGGFQGGSADFGDIFEGLFGGRSGGARSPFGQRAAPKGANIAYRLAVGFEDAAAARAQRVTLGDGKTIDVKLPAGVEHGTQMRLPGKGEPGAGGAGDAILTIEIGSHPFCKREPASSKDGGDAVRLDLPITLAEAVLGASVKVPTVDGPVMLTVPPGTSSGKVLRLRGKGFTGKTGARGDQLVTLMVEVPEGDAALAAWAENSRHMLRNPRSRLGV